MTDAVAGSPAQAHRRGARSRVGVRTRKLARATVVGCLRPTAALRPAPDFVIVGAQRCGTTSLFRALAAHPGVIEPVLGTKGVHYFDTAYDRPLDWYFAHFPSRLVRGRSARRLGHPVVTGEASPYYVFHPASANRMAKDIPDTKLIVLLRDPVRRAYSHYHHMVFEGHETAPTFEAALDLEPARLAGEEQRLLADPSYVSRNHQHFAYLARGQYAEQLRRLQALFPPEQLLVLDSHRFFAEPQQCLLLVVDFLGLPSHPAVVLRALNGGDYPAIAPGTLRRLEEEFAASNAELPALLGWTPSWCR